MLPPEKPLDPDFGSPLPSCPCRWPHQPHLARRPPGEALVGGRREGKPVFPTLPHPLNIWLRTSAFSLCLRAPGRPRTRLPPPAAPPLPQGGSRYPRPPGRFPRGERGKRGGPSAWRGGSGRRAAARGGTSPFRRMRAPAKPGVRGRSLRARPKVTAGAAGGTRAPSLFAKRLPDDLPAAPLPPLPPTLDAPGSPRTPAPLAPNL